MHRRSILAGLITVFILLLSVVQVSAECPTLEEFKARVQENSKNFRDISMVGTVTYKDKDALMKLEPKYAQMYEFKSANVAIKMPDKVRVDGKLGMVKFEYVINGTTKIFRAPTVNIKKKSDYADDPAKLQDALDIGIVTPGMWRDREIEILDDAEALANGELKLRMRWPKGDMYYLAWLDAKDLYLKRFEKYDGSGKMESRVVYSNHKKIDNVVWMPLKVDVYAFDGDKAGTSEFQDVRVNCDLPDTLFQ